MSVLDTELVNSLLGKTVLVGISYYTNEGTLTSQRQFFGMIQSITEAQITLKNPETGELLSLPPDLSGFKKAAPGEYRLRSTGEIVRNPDLLAAWNVTAPAGA